MSNSTTYRIKSRGHQLLAPNLSEEALGMYANEAYESFESDVVEALLSPGMTFVDVGASIGYYALIAARAVGAYGKVFAFEPNPRAFEILETNIILNGYENVTAIQKAVVERTGEKISLASNFIQATLPSYSDEIVESISLDDFFQVNNTTIDFIKVDVDGADLSVWKGMEKILSRGRDIFVLTEFQPIFLQENGINPLDFLHMILKQNLFVHVVWRNFLLCTDEIPRTYQKFNTGYVEPMNQERFPEIIQKLGTGMMNLLCVRREAQLAPIKKFIRTGIW